MTKNEFIEKIAELAVNENNKRGKPLFSSVVIGQACLETGYGQSEIMMKANAVFGIKATANWKGKVYNARTREVYNNISTNITAYFRAYNSLEESIKDYFDLICGLSRYKNAINCKTYYECINAISQAGYATDPNYADLVKKIIKDNNLTDYDSTDLIFSSPYEINKNYTTQVNLNIRKEPTKESDLQEYDKLTADAKKHLSSKPATLKKGTVITCKAIVKNGNDIWLKIPSGYVAGFYKGNWYVK